MGLQDFWIHVKSMKHYIIAAFGTFLTGVYLGFAQTGHFLYFLQGQSDRLREIVEGLYTVNHTPWLLLLYIFFNNILATLLMVYSGAFFALMPLFGLLSNGMLMGYLAERSVPDIGWITFLLSIVPHGIIEIPAVILACAYGIKFGILTAKTILFLPAPARRSAYGRQLVQMLKLSLPLALVLCTLLLTAALIESFVTPVLIH